MTQQPIYRGHVLVSYHVFKGKSIDPMVGVAKLQCPTMVIHIHSKLHSITHVATKVHMILRSFVVLTWMRDTIDLV